MTKELESATRLMEGISKIVVRVPSGIVLSKETKAAVALIRHLRTALDDPEIQASESTAKMITEIVDGLEVLPMRKAASADHVGAVLGVAKIKKISAKNRASAQKIRKPDEFERAKKMILEWYAKPTLYKNRAAANRALLDAKLCNEVTTARKWVNTIITENSPSAAWITRHGPKI